MALEATLQLGGAVVMGLIIGLIELFFVHADERGLGWLSHGLHALPVTIIFVFIAMNAPYVLGLIDLASNTWVVIGVQVIIAIIAMIKIGSAAAITGKVGEKKSHILIIGILVGTSPYIWQYGLEPVLGPLIPF